MPDAQDTIVLWSSPTPVLSMSEEILMLPFLLTKCHLSRSSRSSRSRSRSSPTYRGYPYTLSVTHCQTLQSLRSGRSRRREERMWRLLGIRSRVRSRSCRRHLTTAQSPARPPCPPSSCCPRPPLTYCAASSHQTQPNSWTIVLSLLLLLLLLLQVT